MNVQTILKSKGNSVVTVKPDASIPDAARLLRTHRIGALVVSRDGKAIDGILSERDIVLALADHGTGVFEMDVGRLMSRNVVTCTLADSVSDLAALMTERRLRHIPVVERGSLIGLVSIGDVVKNRIEEVESESNSMRELIAGA
jgi:CBS domain-containing protein